MALALAPTSKTSGLGLGLGLDHVVLEHIPGFQRLQLHASDPLYDPTKI